MNYKYMRIKKYNKNEQMGVTKVAEITGLPKDTVKDRFTSKYAKERWGVELVVMPDGSFKRFVMGTNIELWKVPVGLYKGRPTKK
jgi:hypothetical protein